MAERTWDGGGGDANWQTAANWVGDVAPVAGDDLVFPAGALQTTNTNNFPADTAFGDISFSGPGGGYSISGNAITLTGNISAANTSGTHTFAPALAITGTHNIAIVADGTVHLSGVISGPGHLTRSGGGILALSGANTYAGTTTLSGGYTHVDHATGLGAGDGSAETGTVVNAGGTLRIGNFTIANEAISVSGSGQSGNGVLQSAGLLATLAGPVTLSDDGVAMNIYDSLQLAFTGVVSGPGRFGMGNNGTFVLHNPGNSFTGPVTWGATGSFESVLRLGASNVIPDTAGINIPAAGTLDLNGFSETVASLAGTGSVLLTGVSALTVNQSTSTTFSGTLSGAGSLTKSGAGSLTLSGANTHSGTTSVSGGTLLVNGSQTSSVIVTGGVFGGTGTTGALLASGGTVGPGLSPGILTVGGASFSGGATFAVELNGVTAGAGYDQLNVVGPLSLGGATLTVASGFVPAPGTQFIIIANDGADAVTGTFVGLAEGAVVAGGGQSYAISYAGGTGNDVVLTAVAPVPTVGVFGGITLFLLLATVALWRLRRPTTDGAVHI